jgi:hypothetical protein
MRRAGVDRSAWLTAALPMLALAACTLPPEQPFQPAAMGVGGTPYNPPSVTPPEQIDNDAGQLIGTRASDAGSYDAGPRAPADAGQPLGVAADSGSAQQADDAAADATLGNDDATPGDDAAPPVDSGAGSDDATAPVVDASVADLCPGPLGAGDLAIVELMIASQDGSGDMGQWIEVQSTRACTLDLYGLHAATGAASPDTMDVTSHVYLPANGIFVVANSLDPALDNDLPATPLLFAWAGSPPDVLDTAGGTVTLSNGTTGTVIDGFVYPEFQVLIVGASISFPADCAWSDRASWARWSFSTHDWYSTFQGTPNAPNTDVTCY